MLHTLQHEVKPYYKLLINKTVISGVKTSSSLSLGVTWHKCRKQSGDGGVLPCSVLITTKDSVKTSQLYNLQYMGALCWSYAGILKKKTDNQLETPDID